jgi:hypothetical protein
VGRGRPRALPPPLQRGPEPRAAAALLPPHPFYSSPVDPPPKGKEHLLTERERADLAYKRRVLELAKERKRQLEAMDTERYAMPASYGGWGRA